VGVGAGISSLSTQVVDKPVQRRSRQGESPQENAAEGGFGGKIANPVIFFRINGLRVKHRRCAVRRLLHCRVNDGPMTTVHNRLRGSRGKQACYRVVKPFRGR
jgi:hypothetical protein